MPPLQPRHLAGWLACSALAKLPFNLLLNFLFKKSETRDRENKFAKGSPKFTHPDSDNPALKAKGSRRFCFVTDSEINYWRLQQAFYCLSKVHFVLFCLLKGPGSFFGFAC